MNLVDDNIPTCNKDMTHLLKKHKLASATICEQLERVLDCEDGSCITEELRNELLDIRDRLQSDLSGHEGIERLHAHIAVTWIDDVVQRYWFDEEVDSNGHREGQDDTTQRT